MDLFKAALWNHICAHFCEHMFRWKSSKEKNLWFWILKNCFDEVWRKEVRLKFKNQVNCVQFFLCILRFYSNDLIFQVLIFMLVLTVYHFVLRYITCFFVKLLDVIFMSMSVLDWHDVGVFASTGTWMGCVAKFYFFSRSYVFHRFV